MKELYYNLFSGRNAHAILAIACTQVFLENNVRLVNDFSEKNVADLFYIFQRHVLTFIYIRRNISETIE